MLVHIFGCGVIGTLVGNQLVKLGHRVVGVRRQPGSATSEARTDTLIKAVFSLRAGDAADPDLAPRLGPADAVLLCANPGLRRRNRGATIDDPADGNRLELAARLVIEHFPHARLVLTSSTSVYGHASGMAIAEDGPLCGDPASQTLLAIEQAILHSPKALVLRVGALVGPTRQHVRNRIAAAVGTLLEVRGDPDRPFSWIHEFDLAELITRLIIQDRPIGIINAVAPVPLTVRDYYHTLAKEMAVPLDLIGDDRDLPSRRVTSCRLGPWSPKSWREVTAS